MVNVLVIIYLIVALWLELTGFGLNGDSDNGISR